MNRQLLTLLLSEGLIVSRACLIACPDMTFFSRLSIVCLLLAHAKRGQSLSANMAHIKTTLSSMMTASTNGSRDRRMFPTSDLMPPVLGTLFSQPAHSDLIADGANISFLVRAGKGAISKETLAYYLSQEVHLSRAYLRFASRLLSLTKLPHVPFEPDDAERARAVSDYHDLEQVIELLLRMSGEDQN